MNALRNIACVIVGVLAMPVVILLVGIILTVEWFRRSKEEDDALARIFGE